MKVGQRTLDKDRQEEGVYIVSVAPIVSGLMVLAALLYTVTQGWGEPWWLWSAPWWPSGGAGCYSDKQLRISLKCTRPSANTS